MLMKLKKYLMPATLISVAIAVSVVMMSYIERGFSQTKPSSGIRPEEKGRNERREIHDPEWVNPVERSLVAQESDIIFIGKASEAKCFRTDDSWIIKTRFRYQIERVIKGDVKQGDIVYVSLPGGATPTTPDSILFVDARGYMRPNLNYRQLVMVKEYIPGELKPTRGPQGLFDIFAGERLRPLPTYIDSTRNEDETIGLNELLKEIGY